MNTRIFVKKKEAYRVEADSLGHELKTSLNLNGLSGVTLYNTYDVFNADAHDIDLLRRRVLSEIVTDEVDDALDLEGKTYVAYECLPGIFIPLVKDVRRECRHSDSHVRTDGGTCL